MTEGEKGAALFLSRKKMMYDRSFVIESEGMNGQCRERDNWIRHISAKRRRI